MPRTRAIAPEEAVNLGLNGDQVRLLLFSREDGPPIVRALWKGKPAVNAAAKIFHGLGNPTEVHTDAQGEIPCPDLRDGPWWLLVQVVEKRRGTAPAGNTRRSAIRLPWRSVRRRRSVPPWRHAWLA